MISELCILSGKYTHSLFLSKVSLYLSHRFFMQFVFQHMQQLLRPENDAYSCFVFADAGDIWCFWLLFGGCRSKQEKAFVSLLSSIDFGSSCHGLSQ